MSALLSAEQGLPLIRLFGLIALHDKAGLKGIHCVYQALHGRLLLTAQYDVIANPSHEDFCSFKSKLFRQTHSLAAPVHEEFGAGNMVVGHAHDGLQI